jgi:hypothetical protein
MTQVTATTGALPRQGSRKPGSIIGAVVLVVGAGAAIATGIAVTSDDVAQPSGNTFAQAREAQVQALPRPQGGIDSADRAHLNRIAMGAAAAAGGWAYPTTMDGLVNSGLVPGGNTNTINPADRAHFHRIPDGVLPGEWAYPTTVQDLIESGFVPSGTKTNTIDAADRAVFNHINGVVTETTGNTSNKVDSADRGHLNRAKDAWLKSLDPADMAHLNRTPGPR